MPQLYPQFFHQDTWHNARKGNQLNIKLTIILTVAITYIGLRMNQT